LCRLLERRGLRRDGLDEFLGWLRLCDLAERTLLGRRGRSLLRLGQLALGPVARRTIGHHRKEALGCLEPGKGRFHAHVRGNRQWSGEDNGHRPADRKRRVPPLGGSKLLAAGAASRAQTPSRLAWNTFGGHENP
jgi:hypothetical protein